MIDWRRLAAPQGDLYDVAVILRFAEGAVSPRCGKRFVRRPSRDSRTIFDGNVAVRHLRRKCGLEPQASNGPLDGPEIAIAESLVAHWPNAFDSFALLMDTLNPIVSHEASGDDSVSHSDEDRFGSMYATVHDPFALAECCVHEMAHQKLRAIGVGINIAKTMLLNRGDELYVSPIIKHSKRPMSAVLHATYAFLHVLEMDVALAKARRPDLNERALMMLPRNMQRVREGAAVIRADARFDSHGKAFIEGVFAWAEDALQRASQLLAPRRSGASRDATADAARSNAQVPRSRRR